MSLYYIGIDISKASMAVYDGMKHYRFKNDEEGHHALVHFLQKQYGSIRNVGLIYEETGVYSHPLTLFCAERHIRVSILNPRRSRYYARALNHRHKTDPVDAKMLYQSHAMMSASDFKVPELDAALLEVKQIRSCYELYRKQQVMLRNQLEAIGTCQSQTHHLVMLLKRDIQRLEEECAKLQTLMKEKMVNTPQIAEQFTALKSIPCISDLSALYLCLFFKQYGNTNLQQMTALAGLDPVFKESGTYKGKTRISKQGGSRLRTILFMATLSATRYNDRIKECFTRLKQNGKTGKVAVVACMRKMLRIAYAVYRSGKPYQPLTLQVKNG